MPAMFTPVTELQEALKKLEQDSAFWASLATIGDAMSAALRAGRTVLIAGNGGSAAEADHFAAEIVGRYACERRGYAAIALSASAACVTAIGNDYGFENVFARQVEALGRPGDIFFGLSTSGNSENVLRAVVQAKALGMKTVVLLGRDGGKMLDGADFTLLVPGQSTARIQELQLLVIHTLCEHIDHALGVI